MLKQILIYFINFIRFLLLIVGIVLMCFPFIAIFLYTGSLKDANLSFALSSAQYPWSLFSAPTDLFVFSGIVFFIGLTLFILSYVIKKLIFFLRK